MLCVCDRYEPWVRKETKRFRALVVFGVPARMLANAQMNIGSSGAHAQWFSHWKIRAGDHDIIL